MHAGITQAGVPGGGISVEPIMNSVGDVLLRTALLRSVSKYIKLKERKCNDICMM